MSQSVALFEVTPLFATDQPCADVVAEYLNRSPNREFVLFMVEWQMLLEFHYEYLA